MRLYKGINYIIETIVGKKLDYTMYKSKQKKE